MNLILHVHSYGTAVSSGLSVSIVAATLNTSILSEGLQYSYVPQFHPTLSPFECSNVFSTTFQLYGQCQQIFTLTCLLTQFP